MLLIRPSSAADIGVRAAIDRHHAQHGSASFEPEGRAEAGLARRRDALPMQRRSGRSEREAPQTAAAPA